MTVRQRTPRIPFLVAALFAMAGTANAHPLGNFTINHFARIDVGSERAGVRYVVDMAEIPTFQELQGMGATDAPSRAQLDAYAQRVATEYADGLVLAVDSQRVALQVVAPQATIAAGAAGLPTLRLEANFIGHVPAGDERTPRRLHFEDTNQRDRLGWRELVIRPRDGLSVFDSSAFGTAVTDELRAYPADLLSAPLDERQADLSYVRGTVPSGSTSLRSRDGRAALPSRDRLLDLITVPDLTPATTLLALLIAAALGGLHALSPGHGKTVVGAYLVGTRGTARHAAVLGLTVTITHTIGVFALGLVTLFASQYIVPERLFPILSFTSGAIVLILGLSLFVLRLRAALGDPHDHGHGTGTHDHHHHTLGAPHATDAALTWRSLLFLGVSGGILPCPSALVVLLSAIALHRIGFGLLLIVAFSGGLAGVLTGVGLAVVYAGRFITRAASAGHLVRLLPILSALIISVAGAAICYEALAQAGVNLVALAGPPAPASVVSLVSVLGFGLILGLKHAFDADHLAAVSTIVSERKSVLGSTLVGALWGVGHTVSLLVAGVVVMLLHVEIGARTARFLEFGVALMLIGLGADALRALARGRRLGWHAHGGRLHRHSHDDLPEPSPHIHGGLRLSPRPLLVGMVHGLAGSAALMLLVLTTIPSPLLGFLYIAVFGVGSIGGMVCVSTLVGLPVHLTASRSSRAGVAVRTLAGVFSVGFGLFMVYRIGVVERLLQ